MKWTLPICLLAVLALLLAGFEAREPAERIEDIEKLDDRALEKRPSLRGATAAQERPPAAGTSSEVERGWRLTVQFMHPPTKSDEGHKTRPFAELRDAAFRGLPVRVELRRGTARTILGQAQLDDAGRVTLDVPGLARLGEVDRAASEIHVLPQSDDVLVLRGRRTWLGSERVHHTAVRLADRRTRESKDLRLIVEALRRGGVRGHITRTDGQSVEGVYVRASRASGRTVVECCTDASGRFGLNISQAGSYTLWIQTLDGASAHRKFELAADVTVDLGRVSIDADESPTLTGRITYPDGAPVHGIGLVYDEPFSVLGTRFPSTSQTCELEAAKSFTRTDAEGRFRFYLPGPLRSVAGATIEPAHFGDGRLAKPLQVPRDADERPSPLHGVMRGHGVLLEVVDAVGEPVPNTTFNLWRVEATGPRRHLRVESNEDGQARVWLSRGTRWHASAVLTPRLHDRATLDVSEDVNESTLRFVLRAPDPGSGVRLRLLDPDGRLLSPYRLAVLDEHRSPVWSGRIERTAPHSLALAPGRYTVEARAAEMATWKPQAGRWLPALEDVQVETGRMVDVVLRTQEAAHVAFKITRPAPTVIPNNEIYGAARSVEVRLRHEETDEQTHEYIDVTAGDWQPVRGGLRPGRWHIRIIEAGFHTLERSVQLDAAVETRLAYTLERAE